MKELPAKLKIKVNKTNIRRGKKGESFSCPISRAIQAAIKAKQNGFSVSVGGGTDIDVSAKVCNYGETCNVTYVGVTEREQQRIDDFIEKFDDKKSRVKPCTFRLRLEKDWC